MSGMEENLQVAEVEKRGPGHPKSVLDWDKIDELLIAGCTAPEIAGFFGCSVRTLYTRCETDKGVLYSAYSQEKNAKGESLLRVQQFAKSLGLTDMGDNTLLIWLGKNRLKQSESPVETALAEKALENFDAVMSQLSSLRSDLKIEDNKINEDNKS